MMENIDLNSVTGLVVAAAGLIVAVIAAFIIPKKIMINHIFADLVAEYRKPEMGEAILALFYFYNKCTKNHLNIITQYKELYEDQIEKKIIGNNPNPTDLSRTLHFQRRLVAQFYADMAELRMECRCVRLTRKKLKNWFGDNELQLLKIILHLHQPASAVFIQAGDVQEPPEIEVPMYKAIYRLYKEVKRILRCSK